MLSPRIRSLLRRLRSNNQLSGAGRRLSRDKLPYEHRHTSPALQRGSLTSSQYSPLSNVQPKLGHSLQNQLFSSAKILKLFSPQPVPFYTNFFRTSVGDQRHVSPS